MVPSIVKNISIIHFYLPFYKNPFLQYTVFKIGSWEMSSAKLQMESILLFDSLKYLVI